MCVWQLKYYYYYFVSYSTALESSDLTQLALRLYSDFWHIKIVSEFLNNS